MSASFDPTASRLVRLLQACNRWYCRAFHHVHLCAPMPLPRRGAAILACNHISGLDPLLLQAVCPRPIVWMMAEEFYNLPALRWVFQAIDAIPVSRNKRDTASTRAAFRALRAGRILGLFPEGRIERTRHLMPFQTGVALLAMRSGVPVYPAFLDGTMRGLEMKACFSHPHQSTMAFGPVLSMPQGDPNREQLNFQTEKLRLAIDSLRQRFGMHPASLPLANAKKSWPQNRQTAAPEPLS